MQPMYAPTVGDDALRVMVYKAIQHYPPRFVRTWRANPAEPHRAEGAYRAYLDCLALAVGGDYPWGARSTQDTAAWRALYDALDTVLGEAAMPLGEPDYDAAVRAVRAAAHALTPHHQRKPIHDNSPSSSPRPTPAQVPPADADATGADRLVALAHSDLHVPHRQLRVTALRQLPTSDGLAYTAQLHLDAIAVGVAENDGHGGATHYTATNFGEFTRRDMDQFIARCRHRGEPVDESMLLETLVNEFDFTRELSRLAPASLTLIRLMSPQEWPVTIRTVAAINTTRLPELAAQLAGDPATTGPGEWQIWTGDRWRHVTTVPDPNTPHGARDGEATR